MTLTDLLVWICFLLNSKGGAPFHCKGCDYTSADWGSPLDYLRDVHGRLSSNSVFLLLVLNFVSDSSLELIYTSLIANIKSSLIHLPCLQLLVLLSYLIEITSFVCIQENRSSASKRKFRQASY